MASTSTPQESQEDYGDLLVGLEDGDLNDFDGLDDFGDDLDEACEQMHRSQKDQEVGSLDSKLTTFDRELTNTGFVPKLTDPFVNGNGIPQAGFTSGNGRPVAPPSSAALERVKKMFAEVENSISADHLDDANSPNKRRKIDQSEEEEEELPEIPAPDFVMMESIGFVTGKGKAVPPPSKAALDKALKIIAAVEEEKDDLASQPRSVIPEMSMATGSGNAVAVTSSAARAAAMKMFAEDETATFGPEEHFHSGTPLKTSGFTTGSGAPVSVTSEESRRKAMAMFGEDEPLASIQDTGPSELATPVKATGFTTGSGAAAPMASQAARQRALAIFGEDDVSTPRRPTTSMLPPAITPFRPLVAPTSTPQRAVIHPEPSEFRTPLRTTTNIVATASAPTLPMTLPKKLQTIEIKTPAPQRRVGLGRTPTSTRLGAKNKFSSPFKNPGPSVNSPLKPAGPLRTSNAVAGPSCLSRAASPAQLKDVSQVFDLTGKLYQSGGRT